MWEFPTRIGSYNEYISPVLELIKFICNVYGLDDAFSQPASVLRKNLLRIIHVKEFSKEVIEGNEPSLVMVVPDIICSTCQVCKDLDICRDPMFNELGEI